MRKPRLLAAAALLSALPVAGCVAYADRYADDGYYRSPSYHAGAYDDVYGDGHWGYYARDGYYRHGPHYYNRAYPGYVFGNGGYWYSGRWYPRRVIAVRHRDKSRDHHDRHDGHHGDRHDRHDRDSHRDRDRHHDGGEHRRTRGGDNDTHRRRHVGQHAQDRPEIDRQERSYRAEEPAPPPDVAPQVVPETRPEPVILPSEEPGRGRYGQVRQEPDQ